MHRWIVSLLGGQNCCVDGPSLRSLIFILTSHIHYSGPFKQNVGRSFANKLIVIDNLHTS